MLEKADPDDDSPFLLLPLNAFGTSDSHGGDERREVVGLGLVGEQSYHKDICTIGHFHTGNILVRCLLTDAVGCRRIKLSAGRIDPYLIENGIPVLRLKVPGGSHVEFLAVVECDDECTSEARTLYGIQVSQNIGTAPEESHPADVSYCRDLFYFKRK